MSLANWRPEKIIAKRNELVVLNQRSPRGTVVAKFGNANEGEHDLLREGEASLPASARDSLVFYGYAGKKKFLTSHRRIPDARPERRETHKIVKKPGEARRPRTDVFEGTGGDSRRRVLFFLPFDPMKISRSKGSVRVYVSGIT